MNQAVAQMIGVDKSYGKTKAVSDCNFEINAGEVFALLGPNGAGKSTTIALLLGLLRPDKGLVRLFGRNPVDFRTRRAIGVMMQDVSLPTGLKVCEIIELASSCYPNPLSQKETFRLSGTTPLANLLYRKLSGGQRRQVQFAVAICGRPKLLFLDEPTVGLDIDARAALWKTVRELVAEGGAVFLTTHYLEEAETLADSVAIMSSGQCIANGPVRELNTYISTRRIEFSTNVPLNQLQGWPEIGTIVQNGHGYVVATTCAEAFLRRLLDTDPSVYDIEVRRAGLAEVFMELTKGEA